MDLFDKISKSVCKISVFGLGYVGTTVAGVFAEHGFTVIGYDVNGKVVKSIASEKLKLPEKELAEIVNGAVRSGKLSTTLDSSRAVKSCDIIIISVQTPISRKHKPNLTFLRSACKAIGHAIEPGKLIIIESTVPPRTTERVALTLENMSGLKCGKDFWLSYCPERLAPGSSARDFVKNEKIIGGIDTYSARLAGHLYSQVVKGKVILTDSLSAEIAKLAENTFRSVNIAFANELALICEQYEADIHEVTKLANTHPRVNIHMPGCGVGGPCLPKDPYLLLSEVKQNPVRSMIKCSMRLNSFMESHMLFMILSALRRVRKDIGKSRISVLGVTYKKGTGDTRCAPSKFIIQGLLKLGACVNVYDPLSTESFGGTRCADPYEAITRTDCLVILTDHDELSSLDLLKVKEIMNEPACIVDGRRMIDPAIAKSVGIKYYGIGFGSKNEIV